MFQLILTVLALSLIAAATVATVRYLPAWAPLADQTSTQVKSGFQVLERAFDLRAHDNAGAAPPVDSSRQDGGLAPYFQNYFPFMPRPPAGYAWTYGYTSQAALESDAYQGNASGGLYWFCLYPISAGGAEGIYRGVKRAQQFFPQSQFYTGPNGAVSCGHPLNSSVPVTYPATISVTFFVRYVAETP
jgi:hypothetical protein